MIRLTMRESKVTLRVSLCRKCIPLSACSSSYVRESERVSLISTQSLASKVPQGHSFAMTFIKTIMPKQATGRLAKLYSKVRGPDGRVDNILTAHSLRPPSLEGHMALYKNVLHHAGNQVPKWFLETIGVLVSLRNACDYCVDHHYAGLARCLMMTEKQQQSALHLKANLPKPQGWGPRSWWLSTMRKSLLWNRMR